MLESVLVRQREVDENIAGKPTVYLKGSEEAEEWESSRLFRHPARHGQGWC